MFRLVYMTFYGSFRGGEEAEHHLHESPWTMTLPLQVLAVLSIVGGLLIGFPGQLFHLEGWSFIDRFLAPVMLTGPRRARGGHAVSFGLEWGLVVLSVAVASLGICWPGLLPRYKAIRSSPAQAVWPSASRSPTSCCSTSTGWTRLYDATVIAGTIKLVALPVGVRRTGGGRRGQRHRAHDRGLVLPLRDLRPQGGGRRGQPGRPGLRRGEPLVPPPAGRFTQGYAMVMVFGAAVLLGIFYVYQTLS